MVTSAVWSFIFLVQLVPVCGAGVSRYSGIQQHVLGEKYGVEWGKGIPIPTTWRLWDLDVDEPNVLFPFRELIGALLWIALLTRPDIAIVVRAVARYCSAPKLIHWKVARSILGYAVRSSFGISFQKGTLTGTSLISFADADYASRSTDRRSVSGGVVMCAGGPVSWLSLIHI